MEGEASNQSDSLQSIYLRRPKVGPRALNALIYVRIVAKVCVVQLSNKDVHSTMKAKTANVRKVKKLKQKKCDFCGTPVTNPRECVVCKNSRIEYVK